MIISLDVVSLFTNISLQLTINIIQQEWARIQQHTTVPMNTFIDIIRFIFNANYFVHDNKCYSMVFGCPMGSCLSPILANITMSTLIKISLGKLSFAPTFLYQYVDDIIAAVPEGSIDEILTVFNDFDQHLKFTVEEEENRSVPFLDTKVIRTEDNTIILDWYQKKTSSGKYVHYTSYHDIAMKTNVILAMKQRIKKITHPTLYDAAVRRLLNILLKNGYPRLFLNRLLYNTTARDRECIQSDDVGDTHDADRRHRLQEPEDPVSYVSLPYIKGLIHKLTGIFSNLNIRVAKNNLLTNRTLFSNLKDRIPITQKSDVVYEIVCSTCERSYIGQCSTSLKQRISLHKSDSRLRPNRCALASHINTTGHQINYEDVRILSTERKYNKRVFLEMCFINEKADSINSRSDIDNLSVIYSSLLLHDSNNKDHRTANNEPQDGGQPT